MSNRYRKEVKNLMMKEDFFLHRNKNHMIWKHNVSGKIIVTPSSSGDWRTLNSG